MEIVVKKHSPENFTACIRVLSIFGVNTISHLNDFWTKPIWCEMYCDVIGQRHYMRNNQMVWNLFLSLPCIIDMWTIVSVFFYFLINLGRLNLRLFEFKLVLYRSKMPNSENCLLYINCQKCTTLCIYIHKLCSKTTVNQSTKSFFLQNIFFCTSLLILSFFRIFFSITLLIKLIIQVYIFC